VCHVTWQKGTSRDRSVQGIAAAAAGGAVFGGQGFEAMYVLWHSCSVFQASETSKQLKAGCHKRTHTGKLLLLLLCAGASSDSSSAGLRRQDPDRP
jgi:hypothetical protein